MPNKHTAPLFAPELVGILLNCKLDGVSLHQRETGVYRALKWTKQSKNVGAISRRLPLQRAACQCGVAPSCPADQIYLISPWRCILPISLLIGFGSAIVSLLAVVAFGFIYRLFGKRPFRKNPVFLWAAMAGWMSASIALYCRIHHGSN